MTRRKWTRGVCYGCGPEVGTKKVTVRGAYLLCSYHFGTGDETLRRIVAERLKRQMPKGQSFRTLGDS